VGRGSQANVELWRENDTGTVYAVKIYSGTSPADSNRVASDAMMSMKLQHPALARGYDILMPEEGDQSPAVLLENLMGGALPAAIKQDQLSPTLMNTTIISLVKGLAFLHSQGVLHRKFGPAKVLLTSQR
jgi:serine/threonine protein kinase